MKSNIVVFSIAIIIAIAGCESSSDPGSNTGTLKLTLIDAPAAYDAVNVQVNSVAVHTSASAPDGDAGWTTINDVPGMYDLLELRNGVTAVLGTNQLPVGNYTQIRLVLGSGSNVVVDGTTFPLDVPSGMQSGLKLTHAFRIEEDQLYELTLDFDAERSVRQQGMGSYRLQPTIRVIATVTSGTISGVAQPDSVRAVIYALNGTDTVATSYADTVTGAFKLMALPEGTYEISAESTVGPAVSFSQSGVAVVRQQDTDLGTMTLQ